MKIHYQRILALLVLFSLNTMPLAGEHKHTYFDKESLSKVVEQRTDKDKARDKYRKPIETLEFFKVAPGMVVAEALPGGGWYSKILANYLGTDGALYGVNYADDMWPRFGFFSEERIQQRIASTKAFPEKVKEFTDNSISSKGFTFADAPETANGTVDRVLFIRALHNLSRFEKEAGTLTQALTATHKLLKPNGLVGVVQHRVAETTSDESAVGQRGYVKQSAIINAFEQAGFDLIASSEMHANPKDKPSEEDVVWRLPPSLSGSKDKPDLREKMQAIGESDRMTLLFKKI